MKKGDNQTCQPHAPRRAFDIRPKPIEPGGLPRSGR